MLSRSAVSDSLWPHGLQPTSLLCPWGFSRQEYWSGLPCPPLGDLPNPGIEPRSPAWQVDSLPSEPPGKPMNTGVDSLTHLQGIFPTQELNQGLLHCQLILYQLSYQGSPQRGLQGSIWTRPGPPRQLTCSFSLRRREAHSGCVTKATRAPSAFGCQKIPRRLQMSPPTSCNFCNQTTQPCAH